MIPDEKLRIKVKVYIFFFAGSIKCTLHRDVWSTFSAYIASEYCALVLWKPTVLTTGSAFKKHYLNITLSNVFAIYSSAVLNDETSKELPNGYMITYEEDFTVIQADKSLLNPGNSKSRSKTTKSLHTYVIVLKALSSAKF